MTRTILAIDTATEQCSVALRTPAHLFERVVPTARGHADMILSLIDEVLREGALSLGQLDGLAFGRGPGPFTGVRIAVGVIQGLSLATGLRVVGISNLAAVAQRVAMLHSLPTGSGVLVCMDARMQEVYWALYKVQNDGLVKLEGVESVASPELVRTNPRSIAFAAGTAWRAYPILRAHYGGVAVDEGMLPRAAEISLLALPEFESGNTVNAAEAQPVYLRDQVASPKAL